MEDLAAEAERRVEEDEGGGVAAGSGLVEGGLVVAVER